jgi:hypothetical protein
LLAGEAVRRRDLCIVHGPGSFGRQVTAGAEKIAGRLGIRILRSGSDEQIPPPGISAEWDLFSAGVFEQDAETASNALKLPVPPSRVCAIAAGVNEFRNAVDDPEGVFGIAQWFPGGKAEVEIGPSESEFIRAYAGDSDVLPDYPAVQAAAGAILATHCARLAGGTSRKDLWDAAVGLQTSTLFGSFGIDPDNGTQVAHRMVLVHWTDGRLEPVST